MSDFDKIAKQMREDWNRRIAHDYRFWMSESHSDDASMWNSGARDCEILLEGISGGGDKSILEIGCGIGRLLKPNLKKFGKVIGFDVAEKAINKAKELLASANNLELYAGDGFSLKPLTDQSLDVVFSFAAITSMPVAVMSNYLREIHRVLKNTGVVRLQLYVGQEQLVSNHDTLHLRCFKRENLEAAMVAAGFEIDFIKELVLPFPISFKDVGFEAVIVSLRRSDAQAESADAIASTLLPGGESQSEGALAGTDVECWMSLNYASDLAQKGDIEKAQKTLEYALTFVKTTTIDIRDLLDRVVKEIELADKKRKGAKPLAAPARFVAEVFEKNLNVIKQRFPDLVSQILESSLADSRLQSRDSAQGPVIFYDGLCLDHADKPQGAADVWSKRSLDDKRLKEAKRLAVFGFAAGYHIESLLQQSDKPVAIIEPSVEVFNMALGIRDLTKVLAKVERIVLGQKFTSDWLDGSYELLVRPQTQSIYANLYSELKSTFYGKRALTQFRPNIAVIGPMEGGTLPIMSYCGRALLSLGQRTRVLDMSGFSSGFHQLDKFVHDKLRRNGIESTYVETMAQVALEAFDEKPIDILICMAQAPMTGRVLTELRRRGVITVLWFVEDYLRFTYWREIAQYYDFIFTIQKGECISAIQNAGAGHVHYLPVGCDPIVHYPQQLTAEEKARWGSPVSFVGAGYHNRQQMMAAICELPFKIWGTEWPECKPFDRLLQEGGRRLSPEEYIKIFNGTDINLNLHSSSERDGVDPFGDFVNPRTFELAATNAFQLVDERTLLPEVFEPGKEVVTFTDLDDMRAKIDYYLNHPEERQAITLRARERALREHTYAHRIQEMLTIIYARCYERLKDRTERSPWKKMLQRASGHPELLDRCNQAYQRGEEPSLDALISDIVQGQGKLSETERLLLFLFHVRKQIIRMKIEEKV